MSSEAAMHADIKDKRDDLKQQRLVEYNSVFMRFKGLYLSEFLLPLGFILRRIFCFVFKLRKNYRRPLNM